MFGSENIYDALNVSGVTSLLGDYGGVKALFAAMMIPQDCEATETINFYKSSPVPTREYEEYIYSINCRANSEIESMTIAQATLTAINRVSFTDYYIVCSLLVTVPPMDDTDSFNTPIEATLKKR